MPDLSTDPILDDPSTDAVRLPRPLTDARFQGVHIALMSHLSRVPAHESGTPGEYLFALVITPAVAQAQDAGQPDTVTLEDRDIPGPVTLADLLPWNFGALSVDVAVQAGDVTAPWQTVPNVQVLTLPPAPTGPTAADIHELENWLSQRVALASDAAARMARETLARAGTSLFPYNFALQQAVCFRVTGLPAETQTFRVAALPRFAHHGPATAVPTGFLPPIVGWDAGVENAHQIPVAAYEQCVEFPALATPAEALIDLKTQRIKLADADRVGGEAGNWIAQLEMRTGGLFDLPQRLLEAVSTDPGSMTDAPARRSTWSWILASSRDLADTGCRPAPSGLSLPLEVAQQALGTSGAFTQPVRALAAALTLLLQTYENATFATPSAWLNFLSGRIAAPTSDEETRVTALFADLPAGDWPESTPPDESVARWARFVSDLRAPENLRAVVLRQWKAALVAPVNGQAPEDLLAALSSILRVAESPATLLARGIAGRFWPAIIHVQGNAGTAPSVIAAAACQQFLDEYVAHRDDASPIFLPPPSAALPPLTLLTPARAQEAIFPGLAAASTGQRLPERTPHPLVLQVDQLAAQVTVDQTGDLSDLLREVAGVAIFVQDKSQPGARGLNFGLMQLPDLADPTRPPVSLTTLQIAPSRLGYVNGGRTAHLTYNNASLIARSEGGRINQRTAGEVQGANPAPATLTPYFELPPKGHALRLPSRLPGLAYGRSYGVHGFVVLNAGILPPELADPSHPAILRHPLPDDGLTQLGLESFQVAYKRRVGIGAPSLPAQQAPIFARQKNVAPLAIELLAAQGVRPGEEPPLAMLFPAGSDAALPSVAEFEVSKPATDFENWDRWVAGLGFRGKSANDLRDLRVAVRAQIAALRDNGSRAPELDDPALEDQLLLVCEQLFAHPAAAIPTPQHIQVDMTNELRGTPVKVRIVHGGVPRVQPSPGTVDITLPAGSVWRLKFYAVLGAAARAQFDAIPLPAEAIADQANAFAVSPLELILELAVGHSALPAWPDIAAALQPQAEGRHLALDLQRPNPAFAFLSNIETNVQIWNWTGRPVAPFPFGEFTPGGGPNGAALQAWDVQGFGHRPDGAVRAQQIRVAWSASSGALPGPVRLQTENREADPRALYFRWSARAFSRYLALDRIPVTGAGQPELRWLRAILPARLPQKMQKPSLKLVLPTGRRVKNERGEDCLAALAVFNDAWYQQAGLAEELEIQLLSVEFQPTAGAAQSFLEAGHDPIVSATPLNPLGAGAPLPVITAPPPIGHTFDGNASEPLIVGTSFNILLPARLPVDDQGSTAVTADWFLARLQFRRRAKTAGLLGGSAAAAVAASDWTAPEWIQFAPAPADLLPPEWPQEKDADDSKAAVALRANPSGAWEPKTTTFSLGHWQEPYLRSNPGNFDPNRFEYWFVLTRIAQGLGGQPTEAYVATLAPFVDGVLHLVDAAADAVFFTQPGAALVLRVLELRTRDRVSLRRHVEAGGNAWELLFGSTAHENPSLPTSSAAKAGGILNDVQAQITRVSPYVPAQTAPTP